MSHDQRCSLVSIVVSPASIRMVFLWCCLIITDMIYALIPSFQIKTPEEFHPPLWGSASTYNVKHSL